jgi:ankyrin repeat protein
LLDAGLEDVVTRGDSQDVRDLLDRGRDVEARDRYGQTALMPAAHAGHREIVEALIAHRANLNTTAKYGLSALMLAVVAGHAAVVRLLADAGADLSSRGTRIVWAIDGPLPGSSTSWSGGRAGGQSTLLWPSNAASACAHWSVDAGMNTAGGMGPLRA